MQAGPGQKNSTLPRNDLFPDTRPDPRSLRKHGARKGLLPLTFFFSSFGERLKGYQPSLTQCLPGTRKRATGVRS